MPLYEYRCHTCDDVFELRRPMSESNASAVCPTGHDDTVRLLSVFASSGAAMASPSPASSPASRGGGCGGVCACAH